MQDAGIRAAESEYNVIFQFLGAMSVLIGQLTSAGLIRMNDLVTDLELGRTFGYGVTLSKLDVFAVEGMSKEKLEKALQDAQIKGKVFQDEKTGVVYMTVPRHAYKKLNKLIDELNGGRKDWPEEKENDQEAGEGVLSPGEQNLDDAQAGDDADNVIQEENEWVEEPSMADWFIDPVKQTDQISDDFALDGQTAGNNITPNEPMGASLYGTVTFTYGKSADGEFSSNLPDSAGTWYMKAEVEETAQYTGLIQVVKFKVKERAREQEEDLDERGAIVGEGEIADEPDTDATTDQTLEEDEPEPFFDPFLMDDDDVKDKVTDTSEEVSFAEPISASSNSQESGETKVSERVAARQRDAEAREVYARASDSARAEAIAAAERGEAIKAGSVVATTTTVDHNVTDIGPDTSDYIADDASYVPDDSGQYATETSYSSQTVSGQSADGQGVSTGEIYRPDDYVSPEKTAGTGYSHADTGNFLDTNSDYKSDNRTDYTQSQGYPFPENSKPEYVATSDYKESSGNPVMVEPSPVMATGNSPVGATVGVTEALYTSQDTSTTPYPVEATNQTGFVSDAEIRIDHTTDSVKQPHYSSPTYIEPERKYDTGSSYLDTNSAYDTSNVYNYTGEHKEPKVIRTTSARELFRDYDESKAAGVLREENLSSPFYMGSRDVGGSAQSSYSVNAGSESIWQGSGYLAQKTAPFEQPREQTVSQGGGVKVVYHTTDNQATPSSGYCGKQDYSVNRQNYGSQAMASGTQYAAGAVMDQTAASAMQQTVTPTMQQTARPDIQRPMQNSMAGTQSAVTQNIAMQSAVTQATGSNLQETGTTGNRTSGIKTVYHDPSVNSGSVGTSSPMQTGQPGVYDAQGSHSAQGVQFTRSTGNERLAAEVATAGKQARTGSIPPANNNLDATTRTDPTFTRNQVIGTNIPSTVQAESRNNVTYGVGNAQNTVGTNRQGNYGTNGQVQESGSNSQVVGDRVGAVTGGTTRPISDNKVGNVVGPATRGATGSVVNSVSGKISDRVSGNIAGNTTGNVNGRVVDGNFNTGKNAGTVNNNRVGVPDGNMAGNVNNNRTGSGKLGIGMPIGKADSMQAGNTQIDPKTGLPIDTKNLDLKYAKKAKKGDPSEKTSVKVKITRLTLLNDRMPVVLLRKGVQTIGNVPIALMSNEIHQWNETSASVAGISMYMNVRGLKNAQYAIEMGVFKNLSKQDMSLTKLLGMDFSSRKAGQQSKKAFDDMLISMGLASKRGKVMDYTKLKRAYKSGNLPHVLKMHPLFKGLSDEQIDKLAKEIKKTARKFNKIDKNKAASKTSGRGFALYAIGKLFAADAIMKESWETYRGMVVGISSAYRVAKMSAIVSATAGKFVATRVYKMLYAIARHTPLKARAELAHDTVKKAVNTVKDKMESIPGTPTRQHKIDKAERKRIRRENRRTWVKERGKKVFNRIMPKRIRESKGGKFVGKIAQRIGKGASFLGKIFSAPFKVFGFVANIKRILLMAVAGFFGVLFLLLLCVYVIVIKCCSVSTYFTSEEDVVMTSSADSIMGNVMTFLSNAETNWVYALKHMDEQGFIFSSDIRYGSDYVTGSEYASTMGNMVSYVETDISSYFVGNPFTGYDLSSDVLSGLGKQISTIDGGTELEILGIGSSRTSNIKDIICMIATYYENNTDVSDENTLKANSINVARSEPSGLVFAESTEELSTTNTTNVFCLYAQDLFNASHTAVLDLEYVVLPTALNGSSSSGTTDGSADSDEVSDTGVSLDEVTYCPDGDLGGCATYDGFYYNSAGRICLKDQSDSYVDVSGIVTPTDASYESGSSDSCYLGSVEDFLANFSSVSSCYTMWSVRQTTTEYCDNTYCDSYSGEEYSITEFAGVTNTLKNTLHTIGGLDTSYTITNITRTENGSYEITVKKQTEGDWYPASIPTYDLDGNATFVTTYHPHHVVTTITYIVSPTCSGTHHGRYCGGHLKAYVTGYVTTITDDQLDSTLTKEGKVENGEYEHKDVTATTIDRNVYSTAADLFDLDAAMVHTSEPESWTGWTSDNMELVMLKYNMDWEELYGITFSTTLGGQALTSVDQEDIMAAILAAYPDLSEERIEIIETALSYVGNLGYNQAYHGYLLSAGYGATDCSGFVSNLWYSRLNQIYTTVSFKSTFSSTSAWSGFSTATAEPGDILLHYSSTSANHALLYLGEFSYDGSEVQGWSIDCSTVNGIGNVFFRHRNYYSECYVLKPDRL